MGNVSQNCVSPAVMVVTVVGSRVVVVIRTVVVVVGATVLEVSIQVGSSMHIIVSLSGMNPETLHLKPWLFSPSTHSHFTLQQVGEYIQKVPSESAHSARASSSGNELHHSRPWRPSRSEEHLPACNEKITNTVVKPIPITFILQMLVQQSKRVTPLQQVALRSVLQLLR